MTGRIFSLCLGIFLTIWASSASAGLMLSWGPTSDLPNGVLGLTTLVTNGAEVRFTNPGNQGFDVGFALTRSDNGGTGSTGYFGSSDEVNLPNPAAPAGGNYIYFNPDTASTRTIFFHVRFYATGTNDPVDVIGLRTQLEDVERGGSAREWIYSPKITSGGASQILSFSDTSVFNLPTGSFVPVIENVTVAGEPMQRAVPGHGIEGMTQAGKTVGIDLTDTPLSYFRIGTSRTANTGGSWLMGTLGEIELAQAEVPEPATLSTWSVLIAFAGIRYGARRRMRS